MFLSRSRIMALCFNATTSSSPLILGRSPRRHANAWKLKLPGICFRVWSQPARSGRKTQRMPSEIAIVYGASGFLGSHVADALSAAGYRVRLFDRRSSPYRRDDQQMIIGDIMNLDEVVEAAKGADVVYN